MIFKEKCDSNKIVISAYIIINQHMYIVRGSDMRMYELELYIGRKFLFFIIVCYLKQIDK